MANKTKKKKRTSTTEGSDAKKVRLPDDEDDKENQALTTNAQVGDKESKDDDFDEGYEEEDGVVGKNSSNLEELADTIIDVGTVAASKAVSSVSTNLTRASNQDKENDLSRFVRDTLFPRVKFVSNDSQMEVDGVLYNFVLKEMNVEEDCQQDWWKRHGRIVRKKINVRRNNVMEHVKRAYLGKFKERVDSAKKQLKRKLTLTVNLF